MRLFFEIQMELKTQCKHFFCQGKHVSYKYHKHAQVPCTLETQVRQ